MQLIWFQTRSRDSSHTLLQCRGINAQYTIHNYMINKYLIDCFCVSPTEQVLQPLVSGILHVTAHFLKTEMNNKVF